MAVWIIEPRDPLIVRDGKPFDSTPGARATSLDFPFPSTTTGGVRTRAGLGPDGTFDVGRIPDVKEIAVRGPLLVAVDEQTVNWLAPAPADALLLNSEPLQDGLARCKRLVPVVPIAGESTDFDAVLQGENLALVGMAQPDTTPSKPYGYAPRFWHWDNFATWLSAPPDEEFVAVAELGHGGPTSETRTHVSIAPATQTAVEGALFQTRGLEFTQAGQHLADCQRLALAVETPDPLPGGLSIAPGLAPLGGERRLVQWRQSTAALPSADVVRDAIIEQQACRVILLTPAHFEAGWKPQWLLAGRAGVTPKLCAAIVNRPQVVSGWDFALTDRNGRRGMPKTTRRLASAGSVYFVQLDGTAAAIGDWITETWMQCVSDGPQDRLDGFGLAVLGTWSGKLHPPEEEPPA